MPSIYSQRTYHVDNVEARNLLGEEGHGPLIHLDGGHVRVALVQHPAESARPRP